MPWAVICPAVPNKKAGFPVEETGLDFQTVNPERGTGRSLSERELQPELHHAGASRADQRIAGRDVGSRAPAAEPGAAGIVADTAATSAHRRAVGVGEIGVIEHVKELHPELGTEPLLVPTRRDHGEIAIP